MCSLFNKVLIAVVLCTRHPSSTCATGSPSITDSIHTVSRSISGIQLQALQLSRELSFDVHGIIDNPNTHPLKSEASLTKCVLQESYIFQQWNLPWFIIQVYIISNVWKLSTCVPNTVNFDSFTVRACWLEDFQWATTITARHIAFCYGCRKKLCSI